MRVPRVLLPGQALAPGPCEIHGDAAHYLTRVLRRRVGDPVVVCDGAGLCLEGHIDHLGPRSATVTLTAVCNDIVESSLDTHLGIALLRGERMDYALQKACELGVNTISLLMTERVEVRLDARRLGNRMRHFDGVLSHALQQSGRSRLPALNAPLDLATWLDGLPAEGRRLALDPAGVACPATPVPQRIILASGPEGGFTDAEIATLAAADFERVQLGPRILRAETAPVVGLSILQWQFGDLARLA